MAAVAAPAAAPIDPELEPRYLDEEERKPEFYLPLVADYPGLKKAHELPPIYTVEDFLTGDECDRLMELGSPGLKRSIVVDGSEGKTSAPTRTSSSTFLRKSETVWLAEKITALTGKTSLTQEPAQVCRYLHGQRYASHFDAFDLTNEPGRACARTGGQRVATVLVYLNTVEDGGGGTDFPKISQRFFPKRGTALVFFPCTLDGRLDTLALHSGLEALSPKWVCQVWIRQRDFR